MIRTSFFIAICMMLLLNSCHYRWAIKNREFVCREFCTTSNNAIDTIVKDSIRIIEKSDTAILKAYLHCDSLNNIIMDSINTINGKYVRLLYKYNHGRLLITAVKDSIVHDTIVVHDIKVKNVPFNIQPHNKLSWLQQVILFLFFLMLIIVIIRKI